MEELEECRAVSLLAGVVGATGVATAVAGGIAWATVRSQLAAERIVVPADAGRFAGRRVAGPVTALAQAETIKLNALAATAGRTYGELGPEDPAAETARQASLIRSSLYTSVLAFGVAASQVAAGTGLVAIATALRRLDRRS